MTTRQNSLKKAGPAKKKNGPTKNENTGESRRRATQKDVAAKAGVTQATVSMALGNHPSIPSATCAFIQEIARNIGYQPDPYLFGLSVYRQKVRPRVFVANICWLSNWHEPNSHLWAGVAGHYYDGAQSHAHELGYNIEEHALLAPGMTPRRMEQILHTRNIKGILLPPQSKPGSTIDNFRFDKFSTVTFGYTLASPQFHIVSLHHYRSMKIAFEELMTGRGYQRPGLCLSVPDDMRTDRIWSAAFWSEQRTLPESCRVPIFMENDMEKDRFLEWYRVHKPDVIISSRKHVHEWLSAAGVSVPGDVGIALLGRLEDEPYYAGIWQNLKATGAKALDLLIDMIHRGERGIPKVRTNLLIDATWVDGRSVRAKKP